jgi:type III pantothenate kinase
MTVATLDLDVGNSRVKWRYVARDRVERGAFDRAEGWLDPNWNGKTFRPRRVRVSSVAGVAANRGLHRAVLSSFDVRAEFARSTSRRAGVTCGYDTPSALGVDRWLAMLAGWKHLSAAFVVADVGTAATVDFVDGGGVHRGGYIVPGLGAMVTALGSKTARVRVGDLDDQPSLAPGSDTTACVHRGVHRMLIDFVHRSVTRFRTSSDHRAHLLITGGNAAAVSAHIDLVFEVLPELVLDGLGVALP